MWTSMFCAHMCACPKWIIQSVWKLCLRKVFHQILSCLGIKNLWDPFTFTDFFYYLHYSFFRALSFTSQRLRSCTAILNVTGIFSRLNDMVSFCPTSIYNLSFLTEGTGTAYITISRVMTSLHLPLDRRKTILEVNSLQALYISCFEVIIQLIYTRSVN